MSPDPRTSLRPRESASRVVPDCPGLNLGHAYGFWGPARDELAEIATGRPEGRPGRVSALEPRDPARILDMAQDALLPHAERRPPRPCLWVPDQLKSAITRPCRYEAGINRTYEELATHDEAVVVPARPGKPKDKAQVESAVLVAQRWILARLRDHTFFTLAALNEAIWALLVDLNDRPMQQLGVSRRTRYEQLDRPALRPLPTSRYDRAAWKPCRVNIDYHIQVDHHLYSVPYQVGHR